MILGSTVVSYKLSTFLTRLAGGEPMISVGNIGVNFKRNGHPETFLSADAYFYAEKSPWEIHNTDGQDRITFVSGNHVGVASPPGLADVLPDLRARLGSGA